MPTGASSPQPHRSWRVAGTRASAEGPRSAAKWLATLVALLLLAAFAWLVWQRWPTRLPTTHFAAILTGETHKFTVPPIPFAAEDLALLRESPPRSFQFLDLSDLQEADKIADLGQRLSARKMRPQDVLIVYLSACGISDGGAPLLLCRDYDLENKDLARYHVDKLLSGMQQSDAGTKLLVLDTGWIISDPRLGMVLNEFPRLLLDRAQRRQDPSLWIWLTSSLEQSPQVLPAERHTVFGRSFVDGMRGAADASDQGGDGDGFVALDELFPFVVERCQRETGGLQSPVLMRCGQPLEALTRIPSALRLCRTAPLDKPSTTEPPPAKKKEPQTAASQRVASSTPEPAKPGKPTAGKPDQTGGKSGSRASASPAEARAPDDPVRLRQTIEQAWQVRDALESLHGEAGAWSPAEFAPAAWREFNALLLDIDLRSRCGSSFDVANLEHQLATQLDRVRRLDPKAAPGVHREDASLVADRLLAAAGRFRPSAERASFISESQELAEVGSAVRIYYRLCWRMPGYVRWHDETSRRWYRCQRLTELADLLDSLQQGLLQFQKELGQREGSQLAVGASQDVLVTMADSLAETDFRIQALLGEQVDFLAAGGDQPISRYCIAGLLLTDVPRAAQRAKLIESLTSPRAAPQATAHAGATLPQHLSGSSTQWMAVARELEFEARTMDLAATPQAEVVRAKLSSIRTAMAAPSPDETAMWLECRAAGQACEAFHRALREELLAAKAKRPDTAVCWIDARDASSASAIDQQLFFPRLRILPPRTPDRVEIVQNPAGAIRLRPDGQIAELTIHPTNTELQSVTVLPSFDEQQLRVNFSDGRPLRHGRQFPLNLGNDRKARLALRIQPVSEAASPDGGEHQVGLLFQAGDLKELHTIQCVIPKPNDIELTVERVEPTERARRLGKNATELRPLVNRTTYFRVYLANKSELEKQVDVALYRVPNSDWAPGRLVDEYGEPFVDLKSWLFETDTNRVLPGVKPFATTANPVRLPADAKPREIDLSPKPVPPPQPKPGETPAQSPAPAAVEPIDVSFGLACVITNAADPNERWVKWIEINPLMPRDYVSADVSYNLAEQQIRIEVRALDANADGQPDRFPPPSELAKKPVTIVWDATNVVPPGAERNDHAMLQRAQNVAKLGARLQSDPKKTVNISLDVDGYPRAFLFELSLDRDNTGRDLRRNAASIRVATLQMRGGNRKFSILPPDSAAPAKDDKEADQPPLDVRPLRASEPAAFAVPVPGNTLMVGVQLDAPLDAFSFRTRSDVVEVGLSRAGFTPQRFYSDRHSQAWIKEITPAGIAVTSAVHDFLGDHAIPLDIQGLTNARVRVQTRLRLPQNEPPPSELDVVLDGQEPVLERWNAPATVSQGQPIPVSLQVTDLSGPAKAEFGIVAKPGDPLKEDQVKSREDFAGTATNDRYPVSVSLASAELKPGDYFIKVVVTDRVGKQTVREAPITVLPPAKLADKNEPVMGTVQGVVRMGSSFQPDGVTVRIQNSDIPPSVTHDNGRFRFDRVPAGKYTLVARGPVHGYIKQGQLDIELKAKDDYGRSFIIELAAPAETPVR
jgi:hypothetical protein